MAEDEMARLLDQAPPAIMGKGRAASANAVGIEALDVNPAGLAVGTSDWAAGASWRDALPGQTRSRSNLALLYRHGPWSMGVDASTLIGPTDQASTDHLLSWGLGAGMVLLERPQGGRVLAGLAATQLEEGWREDFGIQLEPIPLVGIGAVFHLYQSLAGDRGWLTAGGSYRLDSGLTLSAERDFRESEGDATRFGAELLINHSWTLRMGSLRHIFTWGIGFSRSSWTVDLATIADRRHGLNWCLGIGYSAVPPPVALRGRS
jgi:hypothetical protein